MDGSQAGRGCMVLMVGMLYQKRALPIAWLVYKGKKGHASAERHIQVLEKVIPLLPKESQVILLGDAEYDTTEMLVWIKKNTSWQYVLRTSPQIYVQTDESNQSMRDYPLEKGFLLYLKNVGFTLTSTVILNVIGWWGSCYEKPIFSSPTWRMLMKPVGIIGDDFGLKHSSLTKRAEAFVFTRVTWLILLV